jgi:hypothetical protein
MLTSTGEWALKDIMRSWYYRYTIRKINGLWRLDIYRVYAHGQRKLFMRYTSTSYNMLCIEAKNFHSSVQKWTQG